jgi:hypothetical protein
MFSRAVIWWPQCGQRERGTSRLKGGFFSTGVAASAAVAFCCASASSSSASHWACIISGSRWMTTLRKLPTSRPTTPATITENSGVIQ